ncbi:MAG: hypothetical protein ACXWBM_07725 [Chthoniobacterales bacterium]
MKSRLLVVVSIALVTLGATNGSFAKDPPKSSLTEGAYYGFRGHIYDRSTIAHNFTLYWLEGAQPVEIASNTKIYRKARVARLDEVKSGDAVDGVGQVRKGKLIAVAVAFGDDGVRLPEEAKLPGVSLLPLAKIGHGGGAR